MSAEQRRIVLASRSSQLAQIQTNIVLDTLKSAFPDRAFGTAFMSTQGDKNQSQALYLLGGKSLWTKELEVALLEGEVDMLVHSLKDGCALGAILEREHGEDSLVVKKGYTNGGKTVHTLDDLPVGAVVGTSSVRRVAQLKRLYPGLVFQDVVHDPNGSYAALILAKAGLVRLGFGDRVTSDIAALGVEIRADDAEARRLCDGLTHWQTSWRCLAERALLRVLEGGCSVPVGVQSELVVPVPGEARRGRLRLVGTITALDGQRHVEREIEQDVSGPERAEELGAQLAKSLVESGGREILDEITKDRQGRAVEESAVQKKNDEYSIT
ncbi:hypothetical protein EDB86DRAFT_2877210 [Lactarius hatsudake]|nr:hypothetical protein EDB86DRAFT_2877210 [Lactarius hatsudake]